MELFERKPKSNMFGSAVLFKMPIVQLPPQHTEVKAKDDGKKKEPISCLLYTSRVFLDFLYNAFTV